MDRIKSNMTIIKINHLSVVSLRRTMNKQLFGCSIPSPLGGEG